MRSASLVYTVFALVLVMAVLNAATYNISMNVFYDNGSAVSNVTVELHKINISTFGLALDSSATNDTGNYVNLTFDATPSGGDSNPGQMPDMVTVKVFVYNSTGSIIQMMPDIKSPAEFLPGMFNNSDVTTFNSSIIFINGTNGSAIKNFSGMLFDAKRFVPVENFMRGAGGGGDTIQNRTIYVLRNRNYSLVVMRSGNANTSANDYGSAPQSFTITDGNLTNNLDTLGRYVVEVNFSEKKYYIHGNLSVVGAPTDITYQGIWLYPMMAGKTPLFSGMLGEYNKSSRFNLSYIIEGGVPFSYNISDMGSGLHNRTVNISLTGKGDGLNYILMVLAYKGTIGDSDALYFGAFQNLTIYSNRSMNFTLYPLAGLYTSGSAMMQGGEGQGGENTGGGPPQNENEFTEHGGNSFPNTTRFVVNVNNTDRGQMMEGSGEMLIVTINLTNGSGNGPVDIVYMLPVNSSGSGLIPVHNSTDMEIQFLSGKYAPRKYVVNSTTNTLNITIGGFRPEGSDGTLYSNINIKFYQNSPTCNIQEPPASCQMGSFSTGAGGMGFSPTMFNQKGRLINVLIDDPTRGNKFYFIGVDMAYSGPPDAVFDTSTEAEPTAGSKERTARIGSPTPPIFDHAFVGIKFDPNTINANDNISVLLKHLYDENWNVVWNSSNDENAANIPDRFADYNTSLLNSSEGGLNCDTGSIASTCFLNKTSLYAWIKLPHFSGSDAVLQGGAATASLGSGTSSSSDEYTQKELDFTYELVCPGNSLVVTSMSKNNLISGVTVRVLDANSIKLGDDQTTDADGQATFAITKSDDYTIMQHEKINGYRKADTLHVSLDLCAEEEEEEAPPPEEPEETPPEETPPEEVPSEEPPPEEVPPEEVPPEEPAEQPPPVEEPETPVEEPPPEEQPGLDLGPIIGLIVIAIIVVGAIYFLALAPKK